MKSSIFLLFLFTAFASLGQSTLSTTNKKAIELYTLADNYRVRGQYREALDLLNQAIAKDRNFSEANFRQGLILKAVRDYAQSTKVFLYGLSLTPDAKRQKAYFYELGDNYLQEGNYAKALECIAKHVLRLQQERDKAMIALQERDKELGGLAALKSSCEPPDRC